MRQIGVVVAGVVVGFAGLWLFASPVAGAVADVTGLPRWFTSIGFVTIWFGAYLLIAWRLSRRLPSFRIALGFAFLIPAVTTGAVFAYSHLHDKTVHDDVVQADVKASDATSLGVSEPEIQREDGTPVEPPPPKPMNIELASSSFVGIGHHAVGQIKVIQLGTGGARLTMTGVDIENAPDLHLYMAANEVTGDVGEYKYIARMKGNKGDQQYKLPDDLDLRKYHVVVVWCRAFDVGVAQAPLKPS